jgi:histidinol-phosphate aminotransferase
MPKYNPISENLTAYMLQPTSGYKYRLDIGEWELPVHPDVAARISDFKDVCRYGAVSGDFSDLLKEVKRYAGVSVEADNVLLTNGSDNALRLLLDLYATPESKLLVPVPSYTHFESMLGVRAVARVDKPTMDYKWANAELNAFLWCELELQPGGYDFCYLVNPSMPIGHLLSDEQIKALVRAFPETLFVVDEAYLEFSRQASCAHLVSECPNLVVVKTFSKFFSLASLRIGYLLAAPEVVALLKPFYNYKDITALSVSCALATLKNPDFYAANKAEFFALKEFVLDQLAALGNPKIHDYFMNDGVYFTLICADPQGLKLFFDGFGIAVRNKDADIKGALRVTVGCRESMEAVFLALKQY